MKKHLKSLSLWAIVIFFIVGFVGLKNQARWNNPNPQFRVIYWDVISYYAYLPAAFIYNDLTLKFTDRPAIKANPDIVIWGNSLPNGNKAIKTTMGVAAFYAPFFAGAHVYTHFFQKKYAPNGFSMPYHIAIAFSGLCWAVVGLAALRRLLRKYFDDWCAALAIITVCFASNFYNYAVYEGGMAHIYSFVLMCFFALVCINWQQKITIKNSIYLGALAGGIVLLRPTNIVVLLLPVFIGVGNVADFVRHFRYVFAHKHLVFISILCAFLVFLPQIIYWKSITGSYLFFSYGNERFYFNQPKIVEFVLGYRKGWLVYSPAMVLGLIGIFFMIKSRAKAFILPIVLIVSLSVYGLSCWWAWWFGGSFGSRSMVDFYGFLALPIAAFFAYSWHKFKPAHVVSVLILAFFIHLNMYQTRQYRTGLIHWDGMTKQSYWAIFLQKNYPPNYDAMIQQPDYEAAMRGEKR